MFLAIAILCGLIFRPATAKATLVNSNSIVQDGIEYYIETDKAVYDLGEDVEVLYRITNLRNEEWEVISFFPVWDICIEEKQGDEFVEVWSLHWYGGGHTGPAVLRLQAGEYKAFEHVWSQINHKGTREIEDDVPVLPGAYRVTGLIESLNSSVGVPITIVPEPTLLALFAFGVAILRYEGRRKSRSSR
jgi:hypothetical protein